MFKHCAKLITFSISFNVPQTSSICPMRSASHPLPFLCALGGCLNAVQCHAPWSGFQFWPMATTGRRSVGTGKLGREFIPLHPHQVITILLHPPWKPTAPARHPSRWLPSLGSLTSSIPSPLQAGGGTNSPLLLTLKCSFIHCWFP